MNESAVKIELRIDWSEIDLFGHINNLAIMKYVQASRIHCLEMIGLMQMQSAVKIGPILASTTCQFRRPLFYPGQVVIATRVDQVKRTSFHFHHVITNEMKEVIAEAQDVIVFYDFNHHTKVLIPGEIRERIAELEKNSSGNPG
ncbi:MAG: acyl-CoA thioesterase [Bacteroidota bacterium]